MPIRIEDKNIEFSDEEVFAEYQKRSAEYQEWRQQKATAFLEQKKRVKQYFCETVEETGVKDAFYIPLPDDIIDRVRTLKEKIANDPELKTDADREDEFHDRISEIGEDIEVKGPMPADYIFTNVDIDKYIYTYGFDVHLFDFEKEGDIRRFPTSATLTDDEYIDLLALLIDQPQCSFQNLAHLDPKIKAIYDKVSEVIHNYDFCVFETFCHNYDYAIRMTELREDAHTLLEQLKQNNEDYPYKGFLKNLIVGMSVLTHQQTTASK